MGFGDFDTAMRARETLTRLMVSVLDHERPPYRYGTVISIDPDGRSCMVRFPGGAVDGSNDVKVKLGSIQPQTIGQTVRVDGYNGDKFVADVLGKAVLTTTISTDLPVPTGVVLTQSPRQATLDWNDMGTADTPVDSYEVEFAESADFLTNPRAYTTSSSLFSVPYDPATTVWARVRSLNGAGGASAWSASVPASVAITDFPSTALSDGAPPASSPIPVITAGLGFLTAQWVPVLNADTVTYDVYLSTVSGFTPDPTTLIGSTESTIFMIDADHLNNKLVYGTTYFVRIIARDADGSAAAGAQASGVPQRVETGDVGNVPTSAISDNVAPTTSPGAPTIKNGLSFLWATWTPISNPDTVTYEIHVSTVSNFIPDANSYVGETQSDFAIIRTQGAGQAFAPLAYGTTYYIKLWAKDLDGYAPNAGAQASGTVLQVNTADITAGAVTATAIAANAVDSSKIIAGAVTSVQLGANAVTAPAIAASAVTAAALAAGAVTANKLSVIIGGGNLLLNSSFEDGTLTSWAALNAAGTTSSTIHFFPGTWSAKLTTTTAGQVYLYIPGPSAPLVQPGHKYTASAYYRPDAASPNRQILTYINFYDAGGALTGQVVSDGSKNEVAGDWTRDVVTGTAPANTQKALVFCSLMGTALNEVHYIDNAQFEEGDVVTAYSPKPDEILPGSIVASMIAAGTITGDRIFGGTITATQLASGAVTANKLSVIIGGGNILANSSFEDGTVGAWTTANTITNSSTVAYAGTKSMRAQCTSAVDSNLAALTTPSLQAGLWIFTVWVYLDPAWTMGAVHVAREGGTATVTNQFNSVSSTTTGVWQRLTYSCQVTAPGTLVLVARYAGANAASNQLMYFDAAQLENGEVATAYSPKPDEILPGTIVGNMIQANTIQGTSLIGNTVTAAQMATGTITAASGIIADAAIGTLKLIDGAITTAKIGDLQVQTAKIADGAVTDLKVTNMTVSKLLAGNLTVSVTLTAGSIQTAATGQRVVLDSTGLKAWNSGGTNTVAINSDGSASFTGTVTATAGSIGGWSIAAAALTGPNSILQTASTGKRVVMDGPNDRFVAYDASNFAKVVITSDNMTVNYSSGGGSAQFGFITSTWAGSGNPGISWQPKGITDPFYYPILYSPGDVSAASGRSGIYIMAGASNQPAGISHATYRPFLYMWPHSTDGVTSPYAMAGFGFDITQNIKMQSGAAGASSTNRDLFTISARRTGTDQTQDEIFHWESGPDPFSSGFQTGHQIIIGQKSPTVATNVWLRGQNVLVDVGVLTVYARNTLAPPHFVINNRDAGATGSEASMAFAVGGGGWNTRFGTKLNQYWHAGMDGNGVVKWGFNGTDFVTISSDGVTPSARMRPADRQAGGATPQASTAWTWTDGGGSNGIAKVSDGWISAAGIRVCGTGSPYAQTLTVLNPAACGWGAGSGVVGAGGFGSGAWHVGTWWLRRAGNIIANGPILSQGGSTEAQCFSWGGGWYSVQPQNGDQLGVNWNYHGGT